MLYTGGSSSSARLSHAGSEPDPSRDPLRRSATPVLFLGGVGRSGSTVIAREMQRIEGIVAVGELRYVWSRGVAANHLCGCGLPFRDCAFWQQVLDLAFPTDGGTRHAELAAQLDRLRYMPSLLAPPLRTASFARRHRRFAVGLERLYAAIRAVSGAQVVLDSSKDPSYAYALRSAAGIDLRLVHLVRDSRAVAHSWTRRKVRPEVHWTTEYMGIRPPATTARRWSTYNSYFSVLATRCERSVRLRYEDFVTDPVRGRQALRDCVSDVLVAGSPAIDTAHDLSGNPVRFEAATELRVDDAWRTEMSARDKAVVTAITAPLLAGYGYELGW